MGVLHGNYDYSTYRIGFEMAVATRSGASLGGVAASAMGTGNAVIASVIPGAVALTYDAANAASIAWRVTRGTPSSTQQYVVVADGEADPVETDFTTAVGAITKPIVDQDTVWIRSVAPGPE